MRSYLVWHTQTITDFGPKNITALYNEGYVFTRLGKGVMHQTRSLRLDLRKFELTSENRRILRKTEALEITDYRLPITDYDWGIGKMAKDFYDTKFGKGTMSANKVKELLTDPTRSNFNLLLKYSVGAELGKEKREMGNGEKFVGYAICYENDEILHYAYPFYLLSHISFPLPPNLGMSMMLNAILYSQRSKKRYCYLGSVTRPADIYKLQFKGLEWFDGKTWQTDLEIVKKILHL